MIRRGRKKGGIAGDSLKRAESERRKESYQGTGGCSKGKLRDPLSEGIKGVL